MVGIVFASMDVVAGFVVVFGWGTMAVWKLVGACFRLRS